MQIPLLTNTSFNGWLECVCVCVSACVFEALFTFFCKYEHNPNYVGVVCVSASLLVYLFAHTCIYAHEYKQSRLSCNFVC